MEEEGKLYKGRSRKWNREEGKRWGNEETYAG